MVFRSTSTWAVKLGRHRKFAVLFLCSSGDTMSDGAWEMHQVSCAKYDIWFLNRIH